LVTALLFGFGVSVLLGPFERHAASADPASLSGVGSWSVGDGSEFGPMAKWLDAMATAPTQSSIDYLAQGSPTGNSTFVAGHSDFSITGLPLTQTEQASFQPGVIRVPIEATGMQVLFWSGVTARPVFKMYELDPARPDCTVDSPDPKCIIIVPFDGDPANNGAVPLVPEAFGGLSLGITGDGGTWGGPGVLQAFTEVGGQPYTAIAAPAGLANTKFVHRSGGASYNYEFQQYISRAAPNAWAQVKADFPALPWDPNSDTLARITGDSGQDPLQQLAKFASTAGHELFTFGVMTDLPMWGQTAADARYPDAGAGIRLIELKNFAGQWVVPTSDSISKAVAAGGMTPLYAMDHPVDGGWPIAWVNELDAPASGLSIEKADALAAFIRYIVTDGQDEAVAAGDGRLPPSLVAQALTAANQLILGNCVGTDRQVVVGNGAGPYAPDLPGLHALTGVANCAPVAPPPTTTTAATETPSTTAVAITTSSTPATTVRPTPSSATTVAGPATTLPRSTGGVASAGRVTATTRPPPRPTTTRAAPAPAAPAPAGSTPSPPSSAAVVDTSPSTTAAAVPLPLPMPSDGRGGLDRSTTMLLGSGAFLIGRRGLRLFIPLL
jgi:hypothetical protein